MRDPFHKILKMSWRTDTNFVDCGVFAMRHMEMYKGDGLVGFNCGFNNNEKEQKKQLNELRVKYLAKILLSKLNLNKTMLHFETEEYEKLAGFEKQKLKIDAVVRIEERLRKMISI